MSRRRPQPRSKSNPIPDPETENSCRHCKVTIRRRRDRSGNSWEWVAFLGMERDGTPVYGRFCFSGQRLALPKRQHSPIPIGSPQALERWLDAP